MRTDSKEDENGGVFEKNHWGRGAGVEEGEEGLAEKVVRHAEIIKGPDADEGESIGEVGEGTEDARSALLYADGDHPAVESEVDGGE